MLTLLVAISPEPEQDVFRLYVAPLKGAKIRFAVVVIFARPEP